MYIFNCELGFPANETFCEKMRKFSVAFLKLFCVTSHFFAKINEAKFFFAKIQNAKIWRITKISRKYKNFVKTMSFIAATINCSKELVEFSAWIAQYFKFLCQFFREIFALFFAKFSNFLFRENFLFY